MGFAANIFWHDKNATTNSIDGFGVYEINQNPSPSCRDYQHVGVHNSDDTKRGVALSVTVS